MPESMSISVDDTVTIPLTGKIDGLTWSVDIPGYIDVEATGQNNNFTLTGISSGVVNLSAKVNDLTKTCIVTVSEKYNYKLVPILEPFGFKFLLQTDDPDPLDLRFVDRNSKYKEKEDPYIEIDHRSYVDVKYVDEINRKVNGGYLFSCYTDNSDGGELIMRRRVQKKGIQSKAYTSEKYHEQNHYGGYGSSYYVSAREEDLLDTTVKIILPALQDEIDYLLTNYTTNNMGFFEKMNAVQKALDEISLYPKYVLDTSKTTGRYPYLAVSVYEELGLNPHGGVEYKTYYSEGKYIYAESIYPYVLNSLTFPGLMSSVAKRLDPKCETKSGYYHYLISVTHNSETKYYDGAGKGSTNSFYDTHIKDFFVFDGSDSDFYVRTNINSLYNLLIQYDQYSNEDMKKDNELLEGATFEKNVGDGSWLKVAVEGRPSGSYTYSYALKSNGYTSPVTNSWIDGRYINGNESCVFGAKLNDYPKANIILLNQTYVNRYGKNVNGPIEYYYVEEKDLWLSYDFSRDELKKLDQLPDYAILTHDDVDKLNVDANTNKDPEHGLVYDGSQPPGTPF